MGIQTAEQEKTSNRAYYEAYDDRYRQVHRESLRWFSEEASPIIGEVFSEFSITPTHSILEVGCGEGRDAVFLLKRGFQVLATDISREAVEFCRRTYPEKAECFQVLNCIADSLEKKFDVIYAIAVVHMLVLDKDRDAFYQFIRRYLKPDGIALICTMGDGDFERQSDISTAFDLQERTHEASGRILNIAGTSCRMVSFATLNAELTRNGLERIQQGMTSIEPDFPQMMYVVVKRCDA
ncbi:MAG: class I SAM-dependent methyltransferase [Oscillospiraceae bacterium]|nr:class I SAM-dependent methyltransferase [Oscillospiraceae bacterium]